MKQLLVLAAAGALGFLAWKKLQDEQAEKDLWAEATDSV